MNRARNLAFLFLVSLFGLSFEVFLNRYLTLALYSDYSYWVISVALLGYSFGGVLLTLFRDAFHRHHDVVLTLIPPVLIVAAAAAFLLLRANPFNPLQLQNSVLWKTQVGNILLFYAALFPVFLLTGLSIGLVFLIHADEMPRVYAMDLLGAACGAALVLAALFLVHPYHLPAVMFPLLFAAAVLNAAARPRGKRRGTVAVAAVTAVLLAGGMTVVLSERTLAVPDFKQLHAVLGIATTKIVAARVSPSGTWLTADNYTEYDDVSMTNNYAGGTTGSPPRTLGLYRDGARVSSLPLALPSDTSYLLGDLASFPYVIRPRPSVLLLGTNGGMRIFESAREGARTGVAIEQPGDIYSIVRARLSLLQPGFESAWGITLQRGSAFSLLRGGARKFDVIDVSNDFLTQDSNNSWAFTREAMGLYVDALAPGGILSIPVDISEVDVYSLKMAETIVAALAARGIHDPSSHIMAYRTAWTCRLLVSGEPFGAADIARLVAWCGDRSFDTSWYPGIAAANVEVWNDLPPVSFDEGQVTVSDVPQDALRGDLTALFAAAEGRAVQGGSAAGAAAAQYFNLAPSTMDRPDFYSISRLSKAGSLLKRLEILPEKEIGYILNLAVLGEALLLALVVLFLPFARKRTTLGQAPGGGIPIVKVFLYFSALGLGFFFIELALVKKLSFLLESATLSFAVVLVGVLVFSGLGSWQAGRFGVRRRRALLGALPVIAVSILVYLFALDPLMRAAVGLPMAVRVILSMVLLAPASFALGRPFALGTGALGEQADTLIPWAWAINGSLSVVATPLANILSVSVGWSVVLAAALVLYATTALTFPDRSRSPRAS
jgi:hypothetical protein